MMQPRPGKKVIVPDRGMAGASLCVVLSCGAVEAVAGVDDVQAPFCLPLPLGP